MSFINSRLLDCVAYGTAGGPTFKTRKIPLRSGITRRNPLRARPLYRFHVLYRNLRPEDHASVIAAFNACYGGVYSFRLKDWSDFQATNEVLQTLGTGSLQHLQLTKAYHFGSQVLYRPIRKPVSGTVVMKHNGAPLTATIDYSTGIASFTTTAGHVITWTGEFDVPVMFSDDELSFTGDSRNDEGLFLTSDAALEEDIDQ